MMVQTKKSSVYTGHAWAGKVKERKLKPKGKLQIKLQLRMFP